MALLRQSSESSAVAYSLQASSLLIYCLYSYFLARCTAFLAGNTFGLRNKERHDLSAYRRNRKFPDDLQHVGLFPHLRAGLRPGIRAGFRSSEEIQESIQDLGFLDFSHSRTHKQLQVGEPARIFLLDQLIIGASAAKALREISFNYADEVGVNKGHTFPC